LSIVNFLRPELLPVLYGYRLKIPKDDHSFYTFTLWWDRVYEPESSEIVYDLLRPGDLAIDIGANIGYYTCLFAHCVSSSGCVLAFEPERNNFKRLQHNIELNDFNWVRLFPCALADKSGVQQIYISKENRGDHTLVEIPGREFYEVRTETFSSFASRELPNKTIRLIKIDVQGYELKVLKGMQKTLSSRRIENLIVEFTPYRICEAGDKPEDIFTIIDKLKLECYVISGTMGSRYDTPEKIYADLTNLKSNKSAAFDFHLSLPKSSRK
jgi:FkbM family methyltransferase